MALLLIRHPRPRIDQGYCYGSSDVEVADEVWQASLAALLPPLLQVPQWPQRGAIVTSPLRRCAVLAQALADALRQPLVVEPDLREMDFGAWELRAWDDIAWSEVEAWNQDLLHYAPGGGETLPAVARRMWRAWERLRRHAQAEADGVSDLIVVCHAGSIRMLRACAAWQAGQLQASAPDAAELDAIALLAVQERGEIAYGEVMRLALPQQLPPHP